MTTINYLATRMIHDSAVDFEETRHRFDEQVPMLDPLLTLRLVVDQAAWHDVEAHVDRGSAQQASSPLRESIRELCSAWAAIRFRRRCISSGTR